MSRIRRLCVRAGLWSAIARLVLVPAAARAQDLEPRSYSPSPVGLNFVVVAYSYSSGAVIMDPSLPVTNVKAYMNGVVAGWGRTFGVMGRQAQLAVTLPVAFGDATGSVFEQQRSVSRSGLADFRGRFSVNLYGNPAQTPREFAARARRSPYVGTSLSVTAPTGQYHGDKLINLGTNRWSFRPDLGVGVPWNRFDFEAQLGAWLYSDNPDFFPGGVSRKQEALWTLRSHVSHTFRPSLWVAVDGTWYGGGAASVADGPKTERLDNSRYGATVSYPLSASQSLKIAYSRGAIVRVSSNFSTVSASWQLRWF
jgi:hypothetical protein